MAINASKTLITNSACVPGPLQLGPDGKIYISRCNSALGVINSPNNVGTACNFIDNQINISPCVSNTSLPLFIAGYEYVNTKIPDCVLTSAYNNQIPKSTVDIFPNPANNVLTIQTNEIGSQIEIFDMQGRIVTKGTLISRSITINISLFAEGIYLLRLMNGDHIATQKFFVAH